MRNLTIGAAAAAAAAALLAGCATGAGAQRATQAVTLTGIQEVPGPGDPDGTGTAQIRVEPGQGRVCWTLYVAQIDPATAAHIHRGAAGTAGPPVVTLATPGPDGRSEGCIAVDAALASELSMRAHDFYVNVHNAAFPAGAVRGQLRGGPIVRQRQRAGRQG